MAWSDAARKGAADKKAAKRLVAVPGSGAVAVPQPQTTPTMKRAALSHARGYVRHKMPK